MGGGGHTPPGGRALPVSLTCLGDTISHDFLPAPFCISGHISAVPGAATCSTCRKFPDPGRRFHLSFSVPAWRFYSLWEEGWRISSPPASLCSYRAPVRRRRAYTINSAWNFSLPLILSWRRRACHTWGGGFLSPLHSSPFYHSGTGSHSLGGRGRPITSSTLLLGRPKFLSRLDFCSISLEAVHSTRLWVILVHSFDPGRRKEGPGRLQVDGRGRRLHSLPGRRLGPPGRTKAGKGPFLGPWEEATFLPF